MVIGATIAANGAGIAGAMAMATGADTTVGSIE